MSIALFSEVLGNFAPTRCAELRNRIPGGIDCVYALMWPEYPPPITTVQDNHANWKRWRDIAGVKLWAWINARENQAETALAITTITNTFKPDGLLLDIEGEWTKGAKLTTILAAAKATGLPVRCSLAGTTASHVELDYRGIDAAGFAIDWQSYWISGEGQTPVITVNELYRPSFVIDSWQYRHRINDKGYGWGRFLHTETVGLHGMFDSYKIPGSPNCHFNVSPRAWGWKVDDHTLYSNGALMGQLLGRATFKNIRCSIDVTRGGAAKYTLPEWTAWAASARVAGMGKVPVSVYLAEVCPDDVLIAIGAGAK